jgi:hypothetical protein
MGYFHHFFNAIDPGNADPFNLAVDQHFTGAAFPDSALQASFAVCKAMTVNRESCLVKGGGNGESFFPGDFFPFKEEDHFFGRMDLKDRMSFDFIHGSKANGTSL